MTTRTTAPAGAPCWNDLWTSDVAGSRRFYADLFGWRAEEPDPNFGGYFMFTRDGVAIAGAMGDMGEAKANDTWKPYLATDDIAKTLAVAEAAGGQVVVPAMPVGDAGIQALLIDPTGATIGVWQPLQFPGFTVLDEPGAPSWFELHTRDYTRALEFYRSVFGWDLTTVGDTDSFRYSTVANPAGAGEVAGIMDASGFLPEGVPAQWGIYWHVDDVQAACTKAGELGGSVIMGPDQTPYGCLAVVTDPAGAQFRLRKPNA
ncbi:MAG TPA: VOC family protein [Actinomycetota bacterium]|nr:VOC family protein [Actinomycetota bacterium]